MQIYHLCYLVGTTYYSGAGLGGEGSAWKLLYIVFGAAAFVVGVCVILFLPASPSHARFLDEREKRVALERIRDNSSGTVVKGWKLYQIKVSRKHEPELDYLCLVLKRPTSSTSSFSHSQDAIMDPKLYLALAFTLFSSVPNGALSSFSSLIIKQFGYTSRQTLLLGIPGGFVASCL